LPPKPARAKRRRTTPARPRPDGARAPDETRLLRLARDVSVLAGSEPVPADVIDVLVDRLAAACAAPRARRRDKTRVLALAWAREQLRLAVRDVLDRAADAGQARTDVDRDVVAWLVVAATDALAHDPPEALPDRARALAQFLRRR
jgi:hypothetical protein